MYQIFRGLLIFCICIFIQTATAMSKGKITVLQNIIFSGSEVRKSKILRIKMDSNRKYFHPNYFLPQNTA